ncbi:MAG: CBS domain-containing protein [Hahellaceae bacterium]|jgi:CBS domain-containing membrane protein|nr:CBS domain-containing protein [Hahellaceae bacterium]
MSKPQIAADIMARSVITCLASDTIAHARQLMRDNHIRHLPVVDATGTFVGVLTQKTMLREAFNIANKFGLDEMDNQESKRLVETIVERDAETIQPLLPLLEAGHYFIDCKHGCLPVLDHGKVVGILTSADFVKLSIQLLKTV